MKEIIFSLHAHVQFLINMFYRQLLFRFITVFNLHYTTIHLLEMAVMLIVPVPYLAMLTMDWSKRPSYRRQVRVGSFEHVRGIY